MGTLFPLLRAMPAQGIDKIAYLTCKGTGRLTALQALSGLRHGTAVQALRVMVVVAKEQACEHPDKACHADSCPLARGFYDRLPDARQQAVNEGWLDAAAQRRVALRHGVCPYYRDQDTDRLALLRPDIALWRQDRRMGAEARQGFLRRFEAGGRGIGFAVLGGVFAEGVDLPGSLSIGAFIATPGLPPVSVMQDNIQAQLDKLFGADHGYADLVPPMQKVVQAAGRVLRTPEDRGWLWLLDGRYGRRDVSALLPAWWGI